MKIVGEQRAQCTVDKACHKDLIVRCAALAACESARESARRRKFLFVFDSEGHKIGVGLGIGSCRHCRKQISPATFHHHCTVGLLGQFAGFDRDGPSITQVNYFLNWFWFNHDFVFLFDTFLKNRPKVSFHFEIFTSFIYFEQLWFGRRRIWADAQKTKMRQSLRLPGAPCSARGR